MTPFEKRKARMRVKENSVGVVLLVLMIGLMYAIIYSL